MTRRPLIQRTKILCGPLKRGGFFFFRVLKDFLHKAVRGRYKARTALHKGAPAVTVTLKPEHLRHHVITILHIRLKVLHALRTPRHFDKVYWHFYRQSLTRSIDKYTISGIFYLEFLVFLCVEVFIPGFSEGNWEGTGMEIAGITCKACRRICGLRKCLRLVWPPGKLIICVLSQEKGLSLPDMSCIKRYER